MGLGRWTTVALAAAAMTVGGAVQAHRDPANPVNLKVVVFDRSDLGPEAVGRAQRIAGVIFRRIGVDLTWISAAEFAAGYPVSHADILTYCQSVLQLHLTPISAGGATSPTALGLAPRGGRQLYAFTSRIADASAFAGAEVPVVLGHVIGHEIGHLLLGPDTHTGEGLMQATFDLPRLVDSRLGFDHTQGAKIRSAARRLLAPVHN